MVFSVTTAISATVVALVTMVFTSATFAHTALMTSTATVSLTFIVVLSATMTTFVEMATAMASINRSLLNIDEINRLLFLLLRLKL